MNISQLLTGTFVSGLSQRTLQNVKCFFFRWLRNSLLRKCTRLQLPVLCLCCEGTCKRLALSRARCSCGTHDRTIHFLLCYAQNDAPAEDERHNRPNQGEYMHQRRIVRWFVHAVALRVALTGALHLGRGTTKLTDLDAKAIGEALKTNETVTHVDLSGEE